MSRSDQFDPLVRAHQGAVRTFLCRLCRNRALADELAQESFLKAFRSETDLDTLDNPLSWLLRIAYRCFLDHHRRESRRRDLLSTPDPDSGPSVDATSSKAHGIRLDIEHAMNALPAERRTCAMLCLGYGYSHGDAAEITGLPLGTVKSHVQRAKSALQDRLKAYEGETG